jgi:hypothetical protein
VTENTTIEQEAGTETRRCQWERSQGLKCWREATERLIPEDPDYDICAEHFRAFQTAQATDPLVVALEKMGEWIATVDDGTDEPLLEYAFHMREQAYEDYWRAAVIHKGAELIAMQREGEEPLTREQAERIGDLLLRGQELTKARLILEESPGELFRFSADQWIVAAALEAAQRALGEELRRYRREIKGR